MKRLESIVSKASSGGQSNPSSSTPGNPMPTIFLAWVLLAGHIATFKLYFQSHFDLYLFKEIYISIGTD